MRPLSLVVPVLAAAVAAAPSHAQRTDSAMARRVIHAAAERVEQSYLFSDTGKMVADRLRQAARSGAFDEPMEYLKFAERVTAELRALNGDRHLYLRYAGAPSRGGGPQMQMRTPGGFSPAAQIAANRSNYDVRAAQRLAGNVGYLAIDLLSSRNEGMLPVIDAAMSLLERTDAMIIDLRSTPGGDPRAVDYLASYFFSDTVVPTLRSYDRASDTWTQRAAGPVNGKKRPGIPLYVLVGPGTASGAESFAFTVKQLGRGTIVGSKTSGAGRPTAVFPASDGFVVSVSSGRTIDPRTGAEWERVGIQPDIVASDALGAAHAGALATLIAASSDSVWKGSLEWIRGNLLARQNPFVVPEATLRRYAGTYEDRVVTFENGALWFQRTAALPKQQLVPIDARTFALGDGGRVEFLETRELVSIRTAMVPGQSITLPRTAK